MTDSIAHVAARKGGRAENRKVWLYVVDGTNVDDLALLDFNGFDTWRANPNTRVGDLILMYRTAPFSDIAYVFVASSDPRPTKPSGSWEWKYAVDIADGFHLRRVVKLSELRKNRALKHWSFLQYQQGVMDRRKDLQEEGAWRPLRQLLLERSPEIARYFGRAWTGIGRRRYVFLSYASSDKQRVQKLFSLLSANGIEVWLDRADLQTSEEYMDVIHKAIRGSRAFMVCMSKAWLRRGRYAKQELEFALKVAERRKNFVFPVKLESSRMPTTLSEFHFVELFGDHSKENLTKLVFQLRNRVKG